MQVRDLMRDSQPVVHRDTRIPYVVRLMLRHNVGCIPVVDDDYHLCGLISEADLLPKQRRIGFSTERLMQLFGRWINSDDFENAYAQSHLVTAKEVMRPPIITASEEDSIDEALRQMVVHDLDCLPVTNAKAPVGLLTRQDILRLIEDVE